MADKIFPSWYPASINHVIDLQGDGSTYGEAAPEIMEVIRRRLPSKPAKIIDIAGGDGRYAIPLAEDGHDITIIDLDQPHLDAAERHAASLPESAGAIKTILADVTKDERVAKLDHDFDASLNMAFLYLAPPAEAKAIFKRYAPLHRSGGLAVVQFATNVVRKDNDGNNLNGANEYAYDEAEGRKTLEEMFMEAGFRDVEISSFSFQTEPPRHPYFLQYESLTASGFYH